MNHKKSIRLCLFYVYSYFKPMTFCYLLYLWKMKNTILAKKFILSILLGLTLMATQNSFATNLLPLDSILTELDLVIANKEEYVNSRLEKITSIKKQIEQIKDYGVRQDLYSDLFKLYRSYDLDMALEVSYSKLDLAKIEGNGTDIIDGEVRVAEILGRMGLYKETFDILDKLDSKNMNLGLQSYYYHVYHSTYSLLFDNAISKKEKNDYGRQMSAYKDSLLRTLDPSSIGYKLVYSGQLQDQGKNKKALELVYPIYLDSSEDLGLVGTLGYGVGHIYEEMEDLSKAKYYYAHSAISDLKLGKRGYISLRKLALILYREGDIERAYNYIRCSMEDATLSKSKYRVLEASESLPIISEVYNKEVANKQKQLFIYLVLVSCLSLLLLSSFIYIYVQFKKLNSIKNELKQMFSKEKYQNVHLEDLNSQLIESNQIKEEYIASVFKLCSNYIYRMDNYRVDLNRKLNAGLVAEAIKVTRNSKMLSTEMKNFYEQFDAIFLSIYPNFVTHFNKMLLPEHQISTKEDNTLTAELRVFALVRLGVSDSSKIAEFLNYSPQTVYNYNQRIKHKLAIDKELFKSQVMKIGK